MCRPNDYPPYDIGDAEMEALNASERVDKFDDGVREQDEPDERGTGPDRYPTILRDDRGRPVDVG